MKSDLSLSEASSAATADSAAVARRHRMYDFTSARLPMLQAAGVMILAGTDAGFLNSFDYPGVGLHDELRRLVDAGLTPLQALLRMALATLGYLAAGASILWALVDRDRQFLHDRLAGTRLVTVAAPG